MRAVLKSSISWMVLATATTLAQPAVAQTAVSPPDSPTPPVELVPTVPPVPPVQTITRPAGLDESMYGVDEEFPPPPPAVCGAATTLRSGVAVTGRLDGSDPQLAVDSSAYELFCLPVRRGDRVRVRLTSSDYVPVVQVGAIAADSPDDCDACEQAAGSLRTPAVVNLVGQRTEVLTVRANTFTGGESGAFSLTATVTPAPAPSVNALTWNTPIDAALLSSDWLDYGTDEEPTEHRTDVYSIQLPAGRPVEINMRREAGAAPYGGLDPYLVVGRVDASGQFAEIASDDDGGQGTDARIRFTPQAAGVYQIRARSLDGSAAGDYRLSVGPDTTPPRPAAGAYAVGTRQVVALTATAPEVETETGERYRAVDYRVVLQPGVLYRLTAESGGEGLDPTVEVGPYAAATGAGITVLAAIGPGPVISPDEAAMSAAEAAAAAVAAAAEQSASGLTALFSVQEAGPVVVRVSASGATRQAAFRIDRVAVAPDPATATTLTVPSNTAINLADGGPRIDDSNQLYAIYAVELTEGQRLSVMFNARTGEGAINDPFLAIGTGTPAAFEELASNDDSTDNGSYSRNARLVFTAPGTGTYLIRASALDATDSGRGNLRVALLPPAPPPLPIRVGATVQGELTAENETTADGQPYSAYTIELKQGETIRVRLNALDNDGTFDPYLMVMDGLAADAGVLRENDDRPGGDDTNSELRFAAPRDGTFVIRAAGLSADDYGRYELSVAAVTITPPPAPTPITPGTPVEGTLSSDDPVTDAEGTTFDRYVFEAEAGERYVITLVSQDFDAYLMAGPEGTSPDDWASDDDGGGNLNSRLVYVVETAGRQVVRVSALGDGTTEGSYTLRVEKRN